MTVKPQPMDETAFDRVPPWELRIEPLYRRWFATVGACLTRPKEFASTLSSGSTLWAFSFLGVCWALMGPFTPVAMRLAGHQSTRFFEIHVALSILQGPLQALLLAILTAPLLSISGRLFGGRVPISIALRASAYSVGVAALAAPLQLLMAIGEGTGVLGVGLAWSFLVVIQWRLFNAVARSRGLPVLFSALTAAMPHFLLALFVAIFLALLSGERKAAEELRAGVRASAMTGQAAPSQSGRQSRPRPSWSTRPSDVPPPQ